MTDQNKIDRDTDINKIVEKKIEQKLNQKEQRIEELERKIELYENKEQGEGDNYGKKDQISRRGFLKKLGAGAIGLTGLSLTPVASQLKITKNGFFKNQNKLLGGTDKTEFPNGIDLKGNSINSIGSLNGADLTNATSGQVPTSQGDGTLAMQDVGGGGDRGWTLDGSMTVDGGSKTYNLNSTWDRVLVDFQSVSVPNSGSVDDMTLQLEGVTDSVYYYYYSDGTRYDSKNYLDFQMVARTDLAGSIMISGSYDYFPVVSNNNLGINSLAQRAVFTHGGYNQDGNDAISGNLTQFTVGVDGNVKMKVKVYGRNF